MTTPSLTILIPCLNEARTIVPLLQQLIEAVDLLLVGIELGRQLLAAGFGVLEILFGQPRLAKRSAMRAAAFQRAAAQPQDRDSA